MSVPAPEPAPPHAAPARSGSRWWAALAGVVCASAGFAVAELVAALVAPRSSPILAAGAGVVDQVPPWLKDWAVAAFGTADKAVLLTSIAVTVAVGAALAGVLEVRRAPVGVGLLALVGVVGAVVAVSRPDATPWWAVPTLVGVLVAVALLRGAAGRLREWRPAPTAGPQVSETAVPPYRRGPETSAPRNPDAGTSRRRFLAFTGTTAVVAVLVAAGARVLATGAWVVAGARERLRLPAPSNPAPAVPAGADLKVDGLAPYVTPNDDFYRIDTALRVPQVDPDTWRLRVAGLVAEPFELTFAELLALPLVERHVTLACVSNEVGGDLVGNALWLGFPLRDLLAQARVRDGADMVLSTSADGWTASTPLDVLTDPGRESLLAVGMNGEPLPVEHGFPVRMVVPGLYGYVSATKWVTELRVTRFADDVAYWSTRGWSAWGPVKLASRIDVPRRGARVSGGTVTVAGVAWAQHTGIAAVEVRVDDDAWESATLAETVSADTWRQWTYVWDAAAAGPGRHRLTVRATDADGAVQTSDVAPPAPDGATGWHSIDVRVA